MQVAAALALGCTTEVVPTTPDESIDSTELVEPDPDMPSWSYAVLGTEADAVTTAVHHLVTFNLEDTFLASRPDPWPYRHHSWLDIEYQPASASLTIVRHNTTPRGPAVPLPAVPGEEVMVVWLPRFVPPEPCDHPTKHTLALALPRERVDDRLVAHEDGLDYAKASIPRVIFAAVGVEASCRELLDPHWIARTSKSWLPTEEHKLRYRVLRGRRDGVELAFVGRDRYDAHYGTAERPRTMPNSATIDFERWTIVPLGEAEGEPRFQFVHPDAVERERVWEVDVPITTRACRPNHPKLRKLEWFAGDNDLELGRYEVEGAPRFVRQTAEPTKLTRYEDCSTLFPYWDLYATLEGGAIRLFLYGKPDRRKESKGIYESGRIIDGVYHIWIHGSHGVDCPSPVNGVVPAKALEQARAQRREDLRQPIYFSGHDGPIRLYTSASPSDPGWDLANDECEPEIYDGPLDD